jgi:hypothetical protein
MRQIRHETALRTGCVQREIKGTVVSATLQSEDTYLVEIECDGIDIAAFEIIAVSLPYKRVSSETTAGSRLMLICGADTEVVPGMRVEITVGFPDTQRRPVILAGAGTMARSATHQKWSELLRGPRTQSCGPAKDTR